MTWRKLTSAIADKTRLALKIEIVQTPRNNFYTVHVTVTDNRQRTGATSQVNGSSSRLLTATHHSFILLELRSVRVASRG